MSGAVARLWPDLGSGDPTHSVISARDGSEVVWPVTPPAVARATAIRDTAHFGFAARNSKRLLGLAMAAKVGRFLGRPLALSAVGTEPTSLQSVLGELLGRSDIHLAVHFGPPRGNQKPVVRIFEPSGETLAFAKIGWSEATGSLVENEAHFIGKIAPYVDLGRITVPSLIHAGSWNGWVLALFSAVIALPGRVTPVTEDYLRVAASTPLATHKISKAALFVRFDERSTTCPDSVARTARQLIDRASPGATTTLGRTHGDWTPWNMGRTPQGIVLWDWERTTDLAPLGFDLIHFELQPGLASAPSLATHLAERQSLIDNGLARLGVSPQDRGLLIDLYLADQLLRHGSGASPDKLPSIVQTLLQATATSD